MLDASAVWRWAAPEMARSRPSWVLSNRSIFRGGASLVEASVPGLFRAPVHGCWTGHRLLPGFLEGLWRSALVDAPGCGARGRRRRGKGRCGLTLVMDLCGPHRAAAA